MSQVGGKIALGRSSPVPETVVALQTNFPLLLDKRGDTDQERKEPGHLQPNNTRGVLIYNP
jgi:hypothetical protein